MEYTMASQLPSSKYIAQIKGIIMDKPTTIKSLDNEARTTFHLI
jgi:hypothetical protein